MRKLLSLIIVSIFITSTPVFAIDASTETSRTKKSDAESSKSVKGSKEERESEGKRQSKTVGKGLDKQTQEALKQIGQAMESSNIDLTLPLEVVFASQLAELEKTVEPFQSCQLISNPRLPQSFGLTAETSPGVIDTIMAGYLSNATQSNSLIKNLKVIVADEEGIIIYRKCLAYYGALVGQAYLNLNTDIQDLKANVSKDEEGNIIVKGLGFDDFTSIAEESFKNSLGNISSKTILNLYKKITADESPCRFEGKIEVIQCGNSQITLSAKPQLVSLGIPVYGSGFAGFQGSFKVSRGWSYSDAIEKLKSTSTYSKFADEVSKYAEELESQGKTKEATVVKKKAVELAQSGRQNISLSNLIPSLHQ